jgi:hypothetical protein
MVGIRAETISNYLIIATNDDIGNMGWHHRTLGRSDKGWKIADTKVKIGRTGELTLNKKAKNLPFPISFD